LTSARSAGEFAGLVAEQDAVDEGADGCLFVGVEVGDGFEAELPGLVIGGVVVEDELICAGVEREGESSDDLDPLSWTRGYGDLNVAAYSIGVRWPSTV
jgi:hypothetical protein